jgi:hypothetical protein
VPQAGGTGNGRAGPARRGRRDRRAGRLAEQLESLQVDRARELGWSWAQIAAELGVSKQAVHQKHGARGAKTTGDN